MKTERLYYTDSKLLSFEATIIETYTEDDKHITLLDKTAFYPTSGGQEHDVGHLNDIEVIDVIDDDKIKHISNQKIGNVGDVVIGKIEPFRRRQNMQQHTAQHILSQAFYRLFEFTTMSVHLGDKYGNVEFDTKDISDAQIQKAEQLSNKIIADNLHVKPIIIDSKNIAQYNLRRPPKRSGEIRLIQIEDFECTACGGTHVQSTSEIQMIKILSSDKIRGRVAVNFLAGQQAIEDYQNRFQVTSSIANQLTCSVDDIHIHFDKLIEQNKSLKKDISALQKELMPQVIDSLIQKVQIIENTPVIFTREDRFDKNLINQYASEIAEKSSGIVVILYKDKIIISCANATSWHAGNLVKQFVVSTGLRGGGNKNLAQIGGAKQNDFEKYKSIFSSIIAQG